MPPSRPVTIPRRSHAWHIQACATSAILPHPHIRLLYMYSPPTPCLCRPLSCCDCVQGLWCQGLERLDLCFFSLDRLLRRHCPSLRQHLSDEGVELSMFTSRWFVTLFTCTDVFGRGTSRKVPAKRGVFCIVVYSTLAWVLTKQRIRTKCHV